MKDNLKQIIINLEQDLKNATKEADILNLKAKYLGKKSELNNYLSNLKEMTSEEKKVNGPLLNQIKKVFLIIEKNQIKRLVLKKVIKDIIYLKRLLKIK